MRQRSRTTFVVTFNSIDKSVGRTSLVINFVFLFLFMGWIRNWNWTGMTYLDLDCYNSQKIFWPFLFCFFGLSLVSLFFYFTCMVSLNVDELPFFYYSLGETEEREFMSQSVKRFTISFIKHKEVYKRWELESYESQSKNQVV